MILFWVLAVLLVGTAIFVVTQTKPVYSVVGLLFHFAFLAMLFITLNAEFLALIQIVVYTGAILVLFVFVIALLSSGVTPFDPGPDRMPRAVIPAGLLALAGLGLLVYDESRGSVARVASSPAAGGMVGQANAFGSVADFGKALFTTYLLPFEITAFVLMVAVIGVVILAGKETPYVPSRRQAALVEREMREAILRGGELE
ncbi:MAG: NADH-quinone oxidoreductase subunit J [Candidatus Eremiobacteraeota bacterium]|nr:NADH-quinone oxidoreductase subunit J [Candidatus Eremiobacteraeota bacterium]